MIWDAKNEHMKDELVTFEERTCPTVPENIMQERLDSHRKGSESDVHRFVHGIVFDQAEDSKEPAKDEAPKLVNLGGAQQELVNPGGVHPESVTSGGAHQLMVKSEKRMWIIFMTSLTPPVNEMPSSKTTQQGRSGNP